MAASVNFDCNQYLCFTLSGETYAFRITGVREVAFIRAITPLPSAFDSVAGVINLRGSVIPVVDLRKRFALGAGPSVEEHTIVIIERTYDDETRLIGTIVDGVCGVSVFPQLEICESPGIGLRIDPELVQGITTQDDRTVVLLNAGKLFERGAFDASTAK